MIIAGEPNLEGQCQEYDIRRPIGELRHIDVLLQRTFCVRTLITNSHLFCSLIHI